jgi:hypothetical protein
MRQSRNDRVLAPVSAALALVLDELAELLTLCGVTPGEFVRIAKRSFVIAAAQHAKMRNGRTNASRVAALTGLTRAEVRNLLNPRSSDGPLTVRSRVLRVVDGWLSDVDFLSAEGKPRVLSLDGQENGFKELVRRYSGDIPARAMLGELQHLRICKVKGSAIRLAGLRNSSGQRVMDAVLKLGDSVIPAIRTAGKMAKGEGRLVTRTVNLTTHGKTEFQLMQKRTREILGTTVAALRSLEGLRSRKASNLQKADASRSIVISISLSENADANHQEKLRRI